MKTAWFVLKGLAVCCLVIFMLLGVAMFFGIGDKPAAPNAPAAQATTAAAPAQPTQPQLADVMAAMLSDQFKKDGSEVTVVAAGDLLLFDCSAELNPRLSCWTLYKQPLEPYQYEVYNKVGIHKLKFKTKPGLWADPDWTRRVD